MKQSALAELHVYGVQSVATADWQLPAPSQRRAANLLSPMHVAAAHCVPAATGAQCPGG